MATTIQIKRGTGSAVPSSLAEGELAINLDSGKLFYGSGSSVAQDFELVSPTLSGTPTAPTANSGTNTTQVATTAFTQAAITTLIGGAPGALDTLDFIDI